MEPWNRALFWAPRALCIFFAAFVAMFALDAFSSGYPFWRSLLAFGIHLLPSLVLVFVLLIAWRRGWIGALLFAAIGALYAFAARRHPDWIFVIAGPLFLIAALFLLDWLTREPLPGTSRRH